MTTGITRFIDDMLLSFFHSTNFHLKPQHRKKKMSISFSNSFLHSRGDIFFDGDLKNTVTGETLDN